jgi:hypothetical protein
MEIKTYNELIERLCHNARIAYDVLKPTFLPYLQLPEGELKEPNSNSYAFQFIPDDKYKLNFTEKEIIISFPPDSNSFKDHKPKLEIMWEEEFEKKNAQFTDIYNLVNYINILVIGTEEAKKAREKASYNGKPIIREYYFK